MLPLSELLFFALAALVLVLTPGPNMIYCVSRALCQGRAAGLISLAGVMLGFVVHLLAASLGLTALLLAVPFAFDAIRLAGAAYLLWLAWQAVKPGGTAPFPSAPTLAASRASLPPEGAGRALGRPGAAAARELPQDGPGKLFAMGFVTNVLNPKVAMFYLSFFPQFLHPEKGSVLLQSLQLGVIQIGVSGGVNALLIFCAGGLTAFLSRSEGWLRAQRWVMGSVLALLALRIAVPDRK